MGVGEHGLPAAPEAGGGYGWEQSWRGGGC